MYSNFGRNFCGKFSAKVLIRKISRNYRFPGSDTFPFLCTHHIYLVRMSNNESSLFWKIMINI